MFKSSSEIITPANSISLILIEISHAYELFRRFLHSENTRSDASALVILRCVFHLDVTVITVDELFLVLCEIFQFRYCHPREEPYCNFPFQKSGFLSTAIEKFNSVISVLLSAFVKLLLKIRLKISCTSVCYPEVRVIFASLVVRTSLSQIIG